MGRFKPDPVIEKTETEIQAEIVKALIAHGWEVLRLNAGRKGGIRLHPSGTPDLLAMRNGNSVFIEVKKPGEEPTDIQKARHKEINANGFPVYVFHSVEELMEYPKKGD